MFPNIFGNIAERFGDRRGSGHIGPLNTGIVKTCSKQWNVMERGDGASGASQSRLRFVKPQAALQDSLLVS